MKRLEERFARDMRFVFRHFPMTEIHPLAMLAAESSEAADAQGKFWDMHEVLYENQPHFEPENLIEYANEVGVDEFVLYWPGTWRPDAAYEHHVFEQVTTEAIPALRAEQSRGVSQPGA